MTELELYFQYRCEKGLAKRGLADKPEYKERLEYEMQVITTMHYCGYFLIVSDIFTWALANGIPVGPGRGSVGGSLAAYCLEITHLDPVQYGLIFERFINPDRISMPDIDMDFCEIQRADVIKYVEERYGHDRVAHIGTYGSMKAKAAIRDVARALGKPYALGDKLAKLTLEPIAGKPQPLSVCYEKVPELKNIRHGPDSDAKDILVWAEKIENRMRSFGTHASGVVIARDSVAKSIPLYQGKDGAPTTQFEMNTVEECGLIKFDFLGLRALTTIDRCVKMVAERHGVNIDPLKIPVDDVETYKTLQAGDVAGIFQMEGSSGIRDLLVQIRPTNLEDIAVLVAIYRPGPLGSDMLQHYLKVRAGQAEPQFLTDELKPILGVTDGMLIYQEQILEICKQLAGYTMGEADLMRRAVGKKKEKEMAAQHGKFISGMKKHGISEKDAAATWHDIEAFAAYGFNKAHAACYGYIGYQMAWLKTHYPLEFMCACLISDSDEVDKVIRYISYCRNRGTEVLAPSIDESQYHFAVAPDNKSIRFGLSAIKNLGKPVQQIIEEREANGPFKDIIDFASRVDLSKINKRKLESLVLAGAFDDLGNHNRASLLGAVEEVMRHKEDCKRYETKLGTYNKRMEVHSARQQELAAWIAMTKEEQKAARAAGKKKPGKLKFPEKPAEPAPACVPSLVAMSAQERLIWEKELLGYFVTGHPLDNIRESSSYTIARIKEEVSEGFIQTKFRTRLVAIPSVIKVITTKRDKRKMAYVTLEDKTGTIQTVVLPPSYAKSQELINIQTPALYDVEIEVTEGDVEKVIKLMVLRVRMLPSVKEFRDQPIELTVPLCAARKVTDKIVQVQGKETKVSLAVKSEEGNVWQIGTFSCKGQKADLEKMLKESV